MYPLAVTIVIYTPKGSKPGHNAAPDLCMEHSPGDLQFRGGGCGDRQIIGVSSDTRDCIRVGILLDALCEQYKGTPLRRVRFRGGVSTYGTASSRMHSGLSGRVAREDERPDSICRSAHWAEASSRNMQMPDLGGLKRAFGVNECASYAISGPHRRPSALLAVPDSATDTCVVSVRPSPLHNAWMDCW